ncbi:hypothetical protein WJ542_28860 [Paraburkholderia sp. B3]|uniref:hypothetical protein n=1 Tax=Paraburkholderia sp. B3 TaxID=3134791 RepID=UPI003981A6C7
MLESGGIVDAIGMGGVLCAWQKSGEYDYPEQRATGRAALLKRHDGWSSNHASLRYLLGADDRLNRVSIHWVGF